MSDEEITQEKQWVTLRSGSMQAYVGHGNVANVAHELRCAVGKPVRRVVISCSNGMPRPSVNQSSTSPLNITKYCG